MADRLRLSRTEISRIVGGDPRAIRQFEELLSFVNNTDPSMIVEAIIAAAVAGGQAQEALAKLAVLDRVAAPLAPVSEPQADPLTPGSVPLSQADWLLPSTVPLKKPSWGAFYDTGNQTAALANTAYTVDFDTTSAISGMSISSGVVTVDTSALYAIRYALHFEETGGTPADVYSWLAIDGANVPYSLNKSQIQGNGTLMNSSADWLSDLAAGSTISVKWATSSTNVQLAATSAGAFHPAGASANLVVTDNIDSLEV